MMLLSSRVGFIVFCAIILGTGVILHRIPEIDDFDFSPSPSPRPLQVQLIRVVGYARGNDIQGHFQLTVNGPSNLTHVTIHFNQTLVHNTTQHQFTWPFYTNDYPLGWTRIQVQGFDANDTIYEWTQSKRFVSADVNTPYWIAALLFMIIFSSAIIVAKIQQLRHNSPS
jgi:hypothetical protein